MNKHRTALADRMEEKRMAGANCTCLHTARQRDRLATFGHLDSPDLSSFSGPGPGPCPCSLCLSLLEVYYDY